MDYHLDANGTDGTDPSRIDRVYKDGTRIASDDTKAIAKRETSRAALIARVRKAADDTGITVGPEDMRDALRALAELMGVEL